MFVLYTFTVFQTWLNESNIWKTTEICSVVWPVGRFWWLVMAQSLANSRLYSLDLLRCKDMSTKLYKVRLVLLWDIPLNTDNLYFILLHLQFKENFKSNVQIQIWL